jgi:hypothetical protein
MLSNISYYNVLRQNVAIFLIIVSRFFKKSRRHYGHNLNNS